jgi:hypothetical protein
MEESHHLEEFHHLLVQIFLHAGITSAVLVAIELLLYWHTWLNNPNIFIICHDHIIQMKIFLILN